MANLPAVSTDDFADILADNERFAAQFEYVPLEAPAAKGLGVLTCMDSRLDPLRMLGLVPGDAKIMRNAGARVTDDVLRTLVVASYLLNVQRVMVVAHTTCAMASGTEADLHAKISETGGPDTRSIRLLTTTDQEDALRHDVQRIRSWPYLSHVTAGGFIYDLQTGRLRQVC